MLRVRRAFLAHTGPACSLRREWGEDDDVAGNETRVTGKVRVYPKAEPAQKEPILPFPGIEEEMLGKVRAQLPAPPAERSRLQHGRCFLPFPPLLEVGSLGGRQPRAKPPPGEEEEKVEGSLPRPLPAPSPFFSWVDPKRRASEEERQAWLEGAPEGWGRRSLAFSLRPAPWGPKGLTGS